MKQGAAFGAPIESEDFVPLSWVLHSCTPAPSPGPSPFSCASTLGPCTRVVFFSFMWCCTLRSAPTTSRRCKLTQFPNLGKGGVENIRGFGVCFLEFMFPHWEPVWLYILAVRCTVCMGDDVTNLLSSAWWTGAWHLCPRGIQLDDSPSVCLHSMLVL